MQAKIYGDGRESRNGMDLGYSKEHANCVQKLS
jgi:hypothetical protein